MHDPGCELRRINLPKLFGKGSKIPQACLFGGKKRQIGASSTLLSHLRNPYFGTHSDFPNSFSRDCLETPNGLCFVVPRPRTTERNGAFWRSALPRNARSAPSRYFPDSLSTQSGE